MPEKLQSAELTASIYAALWRPRLVARPSTIPGYERKVAFPYNERLQALIDNRNRREPYRCRRKFVPTALSRTTSYTYT